MEKWYDINRFALEPALKQINDNPVAAGFSVKMEKIKDGRAVARVRFIVTKTAERLDGEEAFKPKEYIPPPEPPPRLIPLSKIPLPTTALSKRAKLRPDGTITRLNSNGGNGWQQKKTRTIPPRLTSPSANKGGRIGSLKLNCCNFLAHARN